MRENNNADSLATNVHKGIWKNHYSKRSRYMYELVQYASECDSLSETLAMTQASLASKQEARVGGGKGVEQRSVLQRQRVSL